MDTLTFIFLGLLEEGGHSELVQESSIDCCKGEGEVRTEDHVSGISDYESIRNARISEHKVPFLAHFFSFSIEVLLYFMHRERLIFLLHTCECSSWARAKH